MKTIQEIRFNVSLVPHGLRNFRVDAKGTPKPLHVAVHNHQVCIWLEYEPLGFDFGKEPTDVLPVGQDCSVVLVETGGFVPDGFRYIGTVLLNGFFLHTYWRD